MTAKRATTTLQIFKTFLKLGLTSFGGPVAHIGYFRKELVEKQRWLTEAQFAQLFSVCQFLPGPASSQLGFILGMVRGGPLGALVAFLGFTMPSVFVLLIFSSLLPYLQSEAGSALIHGLKLVAVAVVADAIAGMVKNLCPDRVRKTIAVFAAATLLSVGSAFVQIAVIVAGAIAGILFCKVKANSSDSSLPLSIPISRKTAYILVLIFSLLLVVALLPAAQNPLLAIAQAFYQAGALVFGGGHVVLPLLQESVVASGWLREDLFLSGYGAAQAIPGPMFSFSAYLGALIQTGYSSWLGALVALVFMFLPGFLLISAVLPAWQKITRRPMAASAVAGVNAAVVGVLLSAFYDPIFTSAVTSHSDLIIAVVGFSLLNIWQRSPLWVVLWCVMSSMLLTII